MKNNKLTILILFYFIIHSNVYGQISSAQNDSILNALGLSHKEFVLLTYSEAFDKYYKSKLYTHEGIKVSSKTLLLKDNPSVKVFPLN